eukprot:94532_1
MDRNKVNHRKQWFTELEKFQLLVPYDADSNFCTVYIQPNEYYDYIPIKQLFIPFDATNTYGQDNKFEDNDISVISQLELPYRKCRDKMIYLSDVLKSYKKPISDRKTFYAQIGFDINDKHIQSIKKRKSHFGVRLMCRLIDELHIDELRTDLFLMESGLDNKLGNNLKFDNVLITLDHSSCIVLKYRQDILKAEYMIICNDVNNDESNESVDGKNSIVYTFDNDTEFADFRMIIPFNK